jgi:hypothetical protein
VQPSEAPKGGLFALGAWLEEHPPEPPVVAAPEPEKLRADVYRAYAEGGIDTAALIEHIAMLAPLCEAESRRRLVDAMMGTTSKPSEPTWKDWPVGKVFVANDSSVTGWGGYHDGNGTHH